MNSRPENKHKNSLYFRKTYLYLLTLMDSTERLFKGYKFRIYPTEEQKLFFDNTFGASTLEKI